MQGCRESFDPKGVVVVDVQKNEEGIYKVYGGAGVSIVPSTVNELIYYPTDWSLLLEPTQEIQHLVSLVDLP